MATPAARPTSRADSHAGQRVRATVWAAVGCYCKPYLPPEEEARQGSARLAEQRHRQRLGHHPQGLPQMCHRPNARVGAGREAAWRRQASPVKQAFQKKARLLGHSARPLHEPALNEHPDVANAAGAAAPLCNWFASAQLSAERTAAGTSSSSSRHAGWGKPKLCLGLRHNRQPCQIEDTMNGRFDSGIASPAHGPPDAPQLLCLRHKRQRRRPPLWIQSREGAAVEAVRHKVQHVAAQDALHTTQEH